MAYGFKVCGPSFQRLTTPTAPLPQLLPVLGDLRPVSLHREAVQAPSQHLRVSLLPHSPAERKTAREGQKKRNIPAELDFVRTRCHKGKQEEEQGGADSGRQDLSTVRMARWLLIVSLASLLVHQTRNEILTPPYFNLAEGKEIIASATCGVDTPGPELYCKLVGASADQHEDINLIQGQVGIPTRLYESIQTIH